MYNPKQGSISISIPRISIQPKTSWTVHNVGIHAWIVKRKINPTTCPICRKLITSKTPNLVLDSNIEQFISRYFPENLKSSEPSPKFDKNLDSQAAWIFQDIFRWPWLVESEDWEKVGQVVFLIIIISGILFIIVFGCCIYLSYETKIWEPERKKREEEKNEKERKARGHQSQDTYIQVNNESFEPFELSEYHDERKMRAAIKPKNRNKKKKSGIDREKIEEMQKQKNLAKMTKIFNQVEAEREAERRKQEKPENDRKQAEAEAEKNRALQDVNNILSEVKQGAQNLVSNFQRGMNINSARVRQSLRKKNEVKDTKMEQFYTQKYAY